MGSEILVCKACSSYALVQKCTCGQKRVSPKPAKYSPQDPYGKYRRAAKKGEKANDT